MRFLSSFYRATSAASALLAILAAAAPTWAGPPTPEGSVDPGPMTVGVAPEYTEPAALATDGTSLLASFVHYSAGDYDGAASVEVYVPTNASAIRVGLDGAPLGKPFSLFVDDGGTSVAFDGQNYVAVTAHVVGQEIVATRVSPAGVVLDPAGIHIADLTFAQGGSAQIAPHGDGTIVVWRRGAGATTEIRFARLDRNGTVLDPGGVQIVQHDFLGGILVAHDAASGVSLVAYNRNANGQLVGVRIAANGTRLDTQPLVLAPSAGYLSNAVTSDGQRFVVAWPSSNTAESARRVGVDGTVDAQGFLLGPAPGTFPATAAGTGDKAAFAWGGGQAARVKNGVVLDAPPVDLQFGPNPGDILVLGAAAAQNKFFAAAMVEEPAPSYRRHAHLAGLDMTTGSRLFGAPVDIGKSVEVQIAQSSASEGAEHLVAWSAAEPGAQSRYALRAARVDASGAVIGAPFTIRAAGLSPMFASVAAGNGMYLVAWRDFDVATNRYTVRASRVTGSGDVLDCEGIVLESSDDLYDIRQVRAVYAGGRFLVGYADRSTNPTAGMHASLIAPNGHVTEVLGLPATAHSFALTGGCEFALGWSDGSALHARAISATGVSGPDRDVATSGALLKVTGLARAADRLLLEFSDGPNQSRVPTDVTAMRVAMLDLDGTPLGGATTIASGNFGAGEIVHEGGRFLATYTAGFAEGLGSICAVPIATDGTFTAAPVSIGAPRGAWAHAYGLSVGSGGTLLTYASERVDDGVAVPRLRSRVLGGALEPFDAGIPTPSCGALANPGLVALTAPSVACGSIPGGDTGAGGSGGGIGTGSGMCDPVSGGSGGGGMGGASSSAVASVGSSAVASVGSSGVGVGGSGSGSGSVGAGGSGGGAGGSGVGGGVAAGGAPATGGGRATGGNGGAGAGGDEQATSDGGGCGCRTAGSGPTSPVSLGLAAMAVLTLASRRRRRREVRRRLR